MALVTLRSPLRELAGGRPEIPVEGATVAEALVALERDYPGLRGWILDEAGRPRPHVALFVGGDRVGADASVAPRDRLHVLGAISGGAVQTLERTEMLPDAAEEEAELLVGTRKGLLVLHGPRGGPMELAGRRFEGSTVEFAMRDRRTGRYAASVTHGQFGPRLYVTDDPLGEWEQANGPAFPQAEDTAVERIWVIRNGVEEGVLWAGVAPAALFRSTDGGLSWSLNRALWDEPSRPSWQPGAGGLCLHSICIWPEDPGRLAVGISAAGVWLSDDAGQTWRRGNSGLVPRYIPEEAREGSNDLCVHNLHRTPLDPSRLYMQFHGGVYRSDDGGQSWSDIGTGTGLPSDFGFPLVVDPHDTESAYVIPLTADMDRVTPDGQVAVYRTSDGGGSWRALVDGLPGNDAYLTVLRQAFCHDGRRPLGLYFGAESGEVFGSGDGGETWMTVAEHLPPVLSVRCSS
jgi:photosystem II stability/assembly factor-like uncharacterized protein/molybdopterin converting factor small subunit